MFLGTKNFKTADIAQPMKTQALQTRHGIDTLTYNKNLTDSTKPIDLDLNQADLSALKLSSFITLFGVHQYHTAEYKMVGAMF